MSRIPLSDWTAHLDLAERAMDAAEKHGRKSSEYLTAHQIVVDNLERMRCEAGISKEVWNS